MKELLLYEDAIDILNKGLKVEPGNRDLKNLLADVTKDLNAMKAKDRRGPDGVNNYFFILWTTNIDFI